MPPYLRLSGMEAFTQTSDTNFINIGERASVTRFRRNSRSSSLAGNFDEALAICNNRSETGAQVIDVNMDEGMLDARPP